ncbi:MAG: hypothetical protein ABL986_23215, partial [Vicinamibacterales bacterium]
MSSEFDDLGGASHPLLPEHPLSRRDLLRRGITAAAGSAALLGSGTAAFAQAPAVQTGTQAGRTFRAFISPPGGGQLRSVETVTLRAIQDHQVVIRTEAAQACYSIVNLLAPVAPPAPPAPGA